MPDALDLRLEIQRIIRTNPGAIFIGTYGQFIRAVKTIRELQFEGKLFSIELDDYLAQETAPLSNGTEFISLDASDEIFNKKILARYGHNPNIPTAQAYDATNLLLSILSQSASQNGALQKMSTLSQYTGVSGNISFSKDGRASFEATPIFELRDGKIVK
jgi:ABC-type branched-subunit amino acid transport system substrate-binding protein